MGESRGSTSRRESRGRAIRKTEEWRRACAILKATRPWVCTYEHCDSPTGRAISSDAPPKSQWSWSADHIVELEDGGPPFDQANLTPMHLRCNIRKGRKRQDERRYEAQRIRAHMIEARTLAIISAGEGDRSRRAQTPPTKTPESWCPLSSRTAGG